MPAKTNKPAPTSLAEYRDSLNTGGSDRAGYLRAGKTTLYPIADGPEAVFSTEVTDVYQGKPGRKYMFFAHVVSAQDPGKLPDDYTSRVIPLVVPKTVIQGIIDLILDEDETFTFTVMNDDGTVEHLGTPFIINRTGTGKETQYAIRPATGKGVAFPDSVTMPDEELQAIADAYTQYQTTKDDGAPAEDEAETDEGGVSGKF